MNARQRVAVLGLDGVPFSLLKKLFDGGVMPNLAAAARSGAFLSMETTLPPVSSVAWTSFMTGKNPGDHGIFGFTDVKRDRIELHLPSFDDIRCPPLWQRLPGKRSVVVNLPFTYPARPLNGALIAGFVVPVFERSVYPANLIPWLKSMDYRTDVDAVKGREDRRFLFKDLYETLAIRERVMLDLMESEPWDLFIGVITGTDRLHHFFFDAAEDVGHAFHSDFMEYYRRVDTFFGRFADRLGNAARLIVLSDHGFTRLKTQVYLNYILRSLGHLSFALPSPCTPSDIHPRSVAFAMDPTRIYINSKERFPQGAVAPGEVPIVREKLRNELKLLRLADLGITDPSGTDRGDDTVFSDVLAKEEVYTGALLSVAPDLIVIPRRGYDPKAWLTATSATMTDIFTGMHTHDDAFLMVNDSTLPERLPAPRITDVAGLVTEILC
jgi:predicted AlkP superfamily phosphohydrolase/phosphomutase